MIFARLRPLLLALALASAAVSGRAAQPIVPTISGDNATFDLKTGENVLQGNARITYGDILLTAEELRYQTATNVVTARGNFVLTQGSRRLVAESGRFDLATRSLQVKRLRLGEFPLYLSGDSAVGTLDEMTFTNATIFFREDARFTPSLRADRLLYRRGQIVRAEGLRLGLLSGHFISLPHFEQALNAEFTSYISGHLGYRGNLGAFAELGLHLPVVPGWQVGADLGLYSSRGVMIGPAARYARRDDNGSVRGVLHSGYINDSGDRRVDIQGRPVPRDRRYLEWDHQQKIGERGSFTGQLNYWSDSEVVRDFKNRRFNLSQQPDSFLEGRYDADNYAFSAFTRFHPNQYHRVQERLPELRFDLLPTVLPLGFSTRGEASAAVLQADAFGSTPKFRTTRLDAYYGLARPINPTPWFNFTPVAGTRATHYTDARGGKDTYTRTLGELGFDSRLLSSGTFDYKNPVWEIDGLRHLLEPKLSYRYSPEADQGRRYIPPIDTRAFSTYLEPLSIADTRHLDDLTALNTARLEIANTLQTRDPAYGSRNLASLNFATDYRFDRLAGQKPLSDLYTTFAITPAPWLRWEVFHRLDPHRPDQQELNTGLTLIDQEWWSLRLATHFLKRNYEEYHLEYRQRLNEKYDVVGLWRYDAASSRFNEQSYGVWQRLGQTWAVKYEVAFYDGPRRESSFALNLEVELLKF